MGSFVENSVLVLRCKSSSPVAALEAPVGFTLRPGLGCAFEDIMARFF